MTPNNAHAQIAIDAARHRKHVYCEKPLAHDAGSARQMFEAVRSTGCVHAISFVYRLWPAVAFTKQLIDEGRIGKVLQFHARFLHEFAVDPRTPLTWRLDAQKAGSGGPFLLKRPVPGNEGSEPRSAKRRPSMAK